MTRALALLALAALLCGCAATPGAPTDAVVTASDPPGGGVLNGTAVLGWVVGAGEHAFVGDQVVGVKSHDQCPARSFFVPADATRIAVEIGPGKGLGAYTIAISSPAGVVYERRVVPEVVRLEEEAPEPGVWRVEALPSGVVANQQWSLAVEVALEEEEEGGRGELALVPDPDCLL